LLCIWFAHRGGNLFPNDDQRTTQWFGDDSVVYNQQSKIYF
jgi:hypothetical protein